MTVSTTARILSNMSCWQWGNFPSDAYVMYVESLVDFGRGSVWLAFWVPLCGPWKAKVIQLFLRFHQTVYRIWSLLTNFAIPFIIQKRRYETFPAHIRPHPNTQPQAVLARGLVRIPALGCFMEMSWGVLDPYKQGQGHAVLSISLTDFLSWQWKSMLFLSIQWFPFQMFLKCNYSAGKIGQTLLPVVDWCRCGSVIHKPLGCTPQGTSRPPEIPRSQWSRPVAWHCWSISLWCDMCVRSDVCHRTSLCRNMCLYIYIYQPTLTWPAQEKAIQVLDLFGEFFRFASLFRFPNGWVTPKSHEIKCLDPHPDLQVAAGWQHPLSWHSAKKTISWWWMGVEMDARMGYVWMEVDGAGVLEVVAVYSWSFWWTTSMNHFCSSFWGSLFASFQLWFNFPRVHLVSREKHTPYKLTTVIPYGLPENCIIPAIPNWIQDPRKSSFTQPSTLQVGRASRSVPIDPYGSSTSVGAEMGTAFSPKLMNYTVSVYPHIHISIYPYIHISLHT